MLSLRGIHTTIYDLKRNKKYEIQGCIEEYKEINTISLYVYKDDKVYIFPSKMVCHDGILLGIVFDLNKEKYFSIKIFPENEKLPGEFCMFQYPTVDSGKIKAAYNDTNKYIDINLANGTYEMNYVDLEDVRLSSIGKDELGVWMTQQDSSSIIYMPFAKNRNIRLFSVQEIVDENPYSYIYCLSKYIVILPRYSNKVVLIEKKTKKIFPISIKGATHNENKVRASQCITCIELNGKIYLFPFAQQEGMIIDTKSMAIYSLKLWCEEKHFNLELQKAVFFYNENRGMGLQILFRFLKNYKNTSILKSRELIGEKIFREV